MLLLGHRGSRCFHSVRENTVAAFDLAMQHGCDGFEFDVRVSSNGVPLVCHNSRIRQSSIARVAASQVPELPTLEAVLERYRSRAFLDIELKVTTIESQVHQLLSRYPPEKGFLLSSFLPRVLLELRRKDASVPLGLICGNRKQLQHWRKLPVDYIVAQQSLVSRRLIQEAHEAEKKVFVWTVNRPAAMLRFAEWGVDGLITDRTDLVAKSFP